MKLVLLIHRPMANIGELQCFLCKELLLKEELSKVNPHKFKVKITLSFKFCLSTHKDYKRRKNYSLLNLPVYHIIHNYFHLLYIKHLYFIRGLFNTVIHKQFSKVFKIIHFILFPLLAKLAIIPNNELEENIH